MMASTRKHSLKLKLNNFQAITEANFEFEQGINLICGETNSGKTAVFRALNGVLLNPKKPQKKYTNYQAKSFNVCMDYLGNEVDWVVQPNKVKYVVNGEDFLKVGNTNLFKVLDKNGFVLGDNGRVMNIEGEMELPFPFDMNSAELFKLFEKSMICTSDTTVILKSMRDKENILDKELNTALYEQNRIQAKYEAVEALEKDVDFNKLNKFRSSLKEMEFRYNELHNNFEGVKQGYTAHKKLQDCMPLPQISTTLESDYESLKKDVKTLSHLTKTCSVLQTSCDIKVTLPDVSSLDQLIKDYKILAHNIRLLKAVKGEIKVPEINVALDEYENLIKDYKKLVSYHTQCLQVVSSVKELQEKITTCKKELDTFKVCPLCGQEIRHGQN